jgi:hypothetical protein
MNYQQQPPLQSYATPPPVAQQQQHQQQYSSPASQQTIQSSGEIVDTLDATSRRLGAYTARVQSLLAQHGKLSEECAALRDKVDAAEKKRDRARLEMEKVLSTARNELLQLQLLTGNTTSSQM